jgi:hypothetical protein
VNFDPNDTTPGAGRSRRADERSVFLSIADIPPFFLVLLPVIYVTRAILLRYTEDAELLKAGLPVLIRVTCRAASVHSIEESIG